MKFGAICPCPECNVTSTGDMNLDIAFSDHRISAATIEAFGNVIRAIRRICDDDQLRFWAFIRFVSVNHPTILRVELSPDDQARCDAVLERAHPPSVAVEESASARFYRESEGSEESQAPKHDDSSG
jgi:hypothetical protein